MSTDGPRNVLPQVPDELRELVVSAPEVEFATLSSAQMPINNPLFHYFGPNGTIDVATGVAYPAKADRARRNRKVGLLFAPGVAAHDPVVRNTLPGQVGSVNADAVDLERAPVTVISALATVRDQDIQANTDRYVRDFVREHPLTVSWEKEQERVWYYARIYIECTPVRALWWPDGLRSGRQPREWTASEVTVPEQDPAPARRAGSTWKWPAPDWREAATRVLATVPTPTLTLADESGFPLPFPTMAARVIDDGFELDLPEHLPWQVCGRAALTFAVSATFLGTVAPHGHHAAFRVERLIGNLPLSGNEAVPRDSAQAREQMMQRLSVELERRGQAIPQVRLT